MSFFTDNFFPQQPPPSGGAGSPGSGGASTGSRFLDYYADDMAGGDMPELNAVTGSQLNSGGTYSSALDGSSPVEHWWSLLRNRTEGGTNYMNIPWEALSDEDQQAITDWFNETLYNPAVEKLRGMIPEGESLPSGERIAESIYASGAMSADELRPVTNTPSSDGGSAGPSHYTFVPASANEQEDWYGGGQVSTLFQISPDIAGHYGINQAAVDRVNGENSTTQAQREATHDAHFNAEAGLVTSAIGGMVAAAAAPAISGATSGLTTNATVNAAIQGAAQGALSGGFSAAVTGGNVLEGAGFGALGGGVSSGVSSALSGVVSPQTAGIAGRALGGAAVTVARGGSFSDALTNAGISAASGYAGLAAGGGPVGSFVSGLTTAGLRTLGSHAGTPSYSNETAGMIGAATAQTGGNSSSRNINWGWLTSRPQRA